MADDYLELSRRGWTQQRIADQFGVSQASVSKFTGCARKYSVANNRPSFWEAYREVDGKTPAEEEAAELKLRAEMRLGEFLSADPNFGRGKKSTTVTDLGISHNDSSRWQRSASIPSDRFEGRATTPERESKSR